MSSCVSDSCPERPPPGIYVIDAETHAPICDATVTAREGDYEQLARGEGAGCQGVYLLSWRTGFYAVTVSAPGYATVQTTVNIVPADCEYELKNSGPRGDLPGWGDAVTVALPRS
jgi:hypothetical protein